MALRSIAFSLALFFVLASTADAAAPRIVVLDAGHGGRRSGTRTQDGVTEAAIVLEISKYARELLEKNGVRVVMSREDDRDIDLDHRVELANGSDAGAYISVHANWAPVSERRGAETYILSANASDEAAEQLVDLENEGGSSAAAAPAAAEPVTENGNDLDLILDDLRRTSAHKDSALLARLVQDSVAQVQGLKPNRGLKQAPFKVLRGAKMPAVLVEVGYLSHPGQATLLASRDGQRRAGEAIARGVLRFFKELGRDERL